MVVGFIVAPQTFLTVENLMNVLQQYAGLPGLAFPAPPDTYPTKDQVADYLRQVGGAKAVEGFNSRPTEDWHLTIQRENDAQ